MKEIEIQARGYAAGPFEIRTELNGPVIGTVSMEYSDVWETYRAACPIPDGVHPLYLTFEGNGGGHLLTVKFIH